MKENILGEYECIDCDCVFEITHTSNSAGDYWMPCCPVCGLDNDVNQVE